MITSAPKEAWKCNYLPFWELNLPMEQPNDQQTDNRGLGKITLPIKKTLYNYIHDNRGLVIYLVLTLLIYDINIHM